MPTTRSTMATSRATASMLMTVRTGRCRTFSKIILLTIRGSSHIAGIRLWRSRGLAQLYQLRAFRLLQYEFFRSDRLVKQRLRDGDGETVILDRSGDLHGGRIA